MVVPKTPDPILLAETGRPKTRFGVQGDNVVAFVWRIADLVPNGLRRFILIRDIGVVVADKENRFAAGHLGPTVRLRRIGSGVTRCPGATWQLEDGEPWPVADPNDRPFDAGSGLLPQDASRAVTTGFQVGGLAVGGVTESVGFILNVDLGDGHASGHGAADGSRLERLKQNDKLAEVRCDVRNNTVQRDLVLEVAQVGRWRDDRPIGSQDVETVQVASGLVADLDDSGLADPGGDQLGEILLVPNGPRGVDE